MEARVAHVKKDPFDLYIGRANRRANLGGSVWANPFKIGVPHPSEAGGAPITREDAVVLYKEWVVRGEGRHLLTRLEELEGKTLGCWCAPRGGVGAHDSLVCHGQILLLLLEHRRRVLARKRTAVGKDNPAPEPGSGSERHESRTLSPDKRLDEQEVDMKERKRTTFTKREIVLNERTLERIEEQAHDRDVSFHAMAEAILALTLRELEDDAWGSGYREDFERRVAKAHEEIEGSMQ